MRINRHASEFESSQKLSRRCTYVHCGERSSEGLGRTQRVALNVAPPRRLLSKKLPLTVGFFCARVTTFTFSRRLINTLTRASRRNKGRRLCLLRSVLPLSVNSTSAPSNEEVQGHKARSAGRQVCTFMHLPLGCLLPW